MKLNRFHEFFEEGDGQLSSIRLFSAVALTNAVILSWFGILNRIESAEIVFQILPWLIAAFVPKALQRFAEAKEFLSTLKKGKTNEPEQL